MEEAQKFAKSELDNFVWKRRIRTQGLKLESSWKLMEKSRKKLHQSSVLKYQVFLKLGTDSPLPDKIVQLTLCKFLSFFHRTRTNYIQIQTFSLSPNQTPKTSSFKSFKIFPSTPKFSLKAYLKALYHQTTCQ
jgi:hypothetical protein